ncbi:dihydroxyacetone kinase subunit DhaK [Carnimonas nigrificans]|uniref:dihydroxyacetone kinase subunit DhaK n=1 Tax=Carnimonas nigrificans TaxID=64323 RepID=UPI00046F603F|nr:dihydroxyacetone kinase subunit DhaK [Carnimonas nigrificans]
MTSFLDNTPDMVGAVLDCILLSPELIELPTEGGGRVVLRNDWSSDNGQVAILSGGGAGHEPAHARFIGPGMLTGAIVGDLFASPSVGAVESAIEAVTGEAGCLLVVKNYTGDRLNFGLAAERCRAKGLNVEVVLVGDDVSLEGMQHPRGLAGTVLIHKIAGFCAGQGASLASVAQCARDSAQQLRTVGLALAPAQLPGQAAHAQQPALGLGIHNEPGARNTSVTSAQDAIRQVVDALDLPQEEGKWIVAVNDLGGCSPQERELLAGALVAELGHATIDLLIGPAVMMSALGMHGFSVTVLPSTPELIEALSAPVTVSAWPGGISPHQPQRMEEHRQHNADVASDCPRDSATEAGLKRVADTLIEHMDQLNELDGYSGDADAGSTFAAGAKALLEALDRETLGSGDRATLTAQLATLLEHSMGGSSGILLSMLFTAASASLNQRESLPAALAKGIEKVTFYGGAREGDRTMLDALIPAVEALQQGQSLKEAAHAAQQGAENTAHLKANAGRAAYVPEEAQKGHMDPGARAIALIFDALAR